MKFLEKDLEDIICETDMRELCKRGLSIYGKLFRQLRIGNYGRADIVTIDKDFDDYHYANGRIVTTPIITVYELKKDIINIDSFLQACTYLKGLREYFNERELFDNADYRVVLVGSKLDLSNSFCYFTDILPTTGIGMDFVEFYTYSYGLNGLKFKQQHFYKLMDNGFKIKKKGGKDE